MKEFLQHLGCIKLGNGINYQPQLVLAGFLPSTVWVCLKIKRPLSSHTIFQQTSSISGERNVWFSNFQKSFPLCPRIYLRLLFIYLLFTMKISKNQPTNHVVNITCSMDFMGYIHGYPSLFCLELRLFFYQKTTCRPPGGSKWKFPVAFGISHDILVVQQPRITGSRAVVTLEGEVKLLLWMATRNPAANHQLRLVRVVEIPIIYRVLYTSPVVFSPDFWTINSMIPSLTLTVCTWKWMVGIRSFPFGARPIFKGELLVSESVLFFYEMFSFFFGGGGYAFVSCFGGMYPAITKWAVNWRGFGISQTINNCILNYVYHKIPRWWFQTFFIFTPT